jgi:SAM-dependent methyltransferase
MNTEFDQEEFLNAYPDGIENNYWTISRNHMLYALIRKNKLHKEKIIEVGCGRGGVIKYLHDRKIDCLGVELAPAIPHIGAENLILTNTDAADIPEARRKTFTVMLLLDVIEHIEDPVSFLRKLLSAYPSVKALVISVPARQEIWSNYDVYYEHYRRYDLQMTREIMEHVQFRIQENRYLFHALYPAGRLSLKFTRQRKIVIAPPKGPGILLHRLVYFYFMLEFFLLPRKWKGTSAVCVGFRE